MIKPNQTASKKELRSFAFILCVGFALIGVSPMILRHADPRRWSLGISVVLAITGAVSPALLRPVHYAWLKLGGILGWVNSKIVLSILYYVVLTPIRLVSVARGQDPMSRRFDQTAKTYRVVRQSRIISHMKHQF